MASTSHHHARCVTLAPQQICWPPRLLARAPLRNSIRRISPKTREFILTTSGNHCGCLQAKKSPAKFTRRQSAVHASDNGSTTTTNDEKIFNLREGKEDDDRLPKTKGMSRADAIEIIGMGTWRLKGSVSKPLEMLVAHVEGNIRHFLEDDIQINQPPKEFRFCDSLDPSDPVNAYATKEDPPKGEPGYPRLQVESRCYGSRVFRKIHLEVARRQDGLEVFHCVFFPRTEYDYPILGLDFVGNNGRVSLAIVDPSPVAPDRSIPPNYASLVQQLQQRYNVSTNRGAPEWGDAIFSSLCVLMRPEKPEDLARFMKYALALVTTNMELARLLQPVQTDRKRRVSYIQAAHRNYCDRQLENSKTQRVLETAFGADFASRYMRELMFSYPGEDDKYEPFVDEEEEEINAMMNSN